MSEELDAIFGKLSAISSELAGLGPGDHERRLELEAARGELHQQATDLGNRTLGGRTPAQLKAELAQLEYRRDQIEHQHVDIVVQTSEAMGDTIGDLKANRQMNEGIDASMGLDEINARIAHIREQLANTEDA